MRKINEFKRYKELRLLILFFVVIFAPNFSPLFGKQGKMILQGRVTSNDAKYVYLSKVNHWIFTPVPFDSIKINFDKTFSKTFLIEDEALFILNGNINCGIIFPNVSKNSDTIDLVIDFALNQFEAIGAYKNTHDFFNKFTRIYRKNGGFDSVYYSNLKLNSQDFLSAIQSNAQQKTKIIQDAALQYNLPNCLVKRMLKTNAYEQYSKMYNYMQMHIYYVKKEFKYFPQDSTLTAALKSVMIDTSDVLLNEYGSFIKQVIDSSSDSCANANNANTNHKNPCSKLRLADTKFSGRTRDLAYALIIKEKIDRVSSPSEFQKIDSIINTFLYTSTSKVYAEFCKSYSSKKNIFVVPVDFKLKTLQNKDFTLNSVKDKTVVLFFWGTWCAPCKKQLPFLNKIIEELNSRDDLAFLNVAMESENFEKWKTAVTKHNIGGTNLYAEGNMNSEELAVFNVTYAPRVVILKKGKISNFNAPFPDNGLKEEILKILK